MKSRIAFAVLSVSLSISTFISNVEHAKMLLQVGILIGMGLLVFEFSKGTKK